MLGLWAYFPASVRGQVSTTLTLFNDHRRDFGGISITCADKLHTRTGTLTVIPGDFKDTSHGYIVTQ